MEAGPLLGDEEPTYDQDGSPSLDAIGGKGKGKGKGKDVKGGKAFGGRLGAAKAARAMARLVAGENSRRRGLSVALATVATRFAIS